MPPTHMPVLKGGQRQRQRQWQRSSQESGRQAKAVSGADSSACVGGGRLQHDKEVVAASTVLMVPRSMCPPPLPPGYRSSRMTAPLTLTAVAECGLRSPCPRAGALWPRTGGPARSGPRSLCRTTWTQTAGRGIQGGAGDTGWGGGYRVGRGIQGGAGDTGWGGGYRVGRGIQGGAGDTGWGGQGDGGGGWGGGKVMKGEA